MQMSYKMGYDSDGNPVWIQEAWEEGVGKRKETRTFAPAVDVVKGDRVNSILRAYNTALNTTTEDFAKAYPELDFGRPKKEYDIVENYEPEDGFDLFGYPIATDRPLPEMPFEKENDIDEYYESEEDDNSLEKSPVEFDMIYGLWHGLPDPVKNFPFVSLTIEEDYIYLSLNLEGQHMYEGKAGLKGDLIKYSKNKFRIIVTDVDTELNVIIGSILDFKLLDERKIKYLGDDLPRLSNGAIIYKVGS